MSEASRPIGIWLVTIWLGLFAGLLPLAGVLFLYFGPAQGGGLIGPTQLVVNVSIALAVVICAFGTWQGSSTARYGLILFACIHYGMIAYQNYQLAVAGVEIRGGTTLLWGRVIRSIVTAIIVAGYLLFASKANSFFDSRSKRVPFPDSN